MPSIPNDQSIDENILFKYTVIAKMGSGAYGHVWKVIDKNNQQTYALKKVYSAFQNQLDAERTYREISILTKLNHDNIVKLYKVFKAKNDFDLYLVFQFIQSDLFKSIKGNILGQTHKKYIVYQIAKSLKYVHSAGILHRDLKPSNILIDTECKIKLCDFGLSRTTFCPTSAEPVITEFIATRWYRAPQVMLGSKSYSYKSDIWSFACLIYQMYAYKALLPGKDNIDQIQKLLQFKGYPNEQQKKALKVKGIDKILGHFTTERKDLTEYFGKIQDPELKKLLTEMLQYDPNKRPSPQEILEHPFLQQLKNYEPEPEAQTPIKLEQSQYSKLKAPQYKQIIYDIFQEKQPFSLELPPNSVNSIQSQKNHHKLILETTVNKKSSNLFRNNSSSVLQTTSKLTRFDQNNTQPSLGKSQKNLLINQAITLPLQMDSNQQKHSFKKHKKDKSNFTHNRNTSIIVIEKPKHQKTTPRLGQSKTIKKSKYTIKKNILHQQNKENQHIDAQRNVFVQPQKPRKSQAKTITPNLASSPYKSRISVYKKSHNDSVSSVYAIKPVSLTKDSRICQQKTPIKRSPFKNSFSLHSSSNSSSVYQKNKLPQLVIKPRAKIVTLGKEHSQFDKKPFHEVINIKYSQEGEAKRNREQYLLQLKIQKIQKKGISQYYNKEI